MIHLRIVAPQEAAHHALDLLCASPSVFNVVHLHDASRKPRGDVILCDVAREEASVIISDLKELEIPRTGSIAVEHIDTSISDAAMAAEKSAPGMPSDAVIWEEVEARTSEDTELSFSFVMFMVAAMQIAAVGIVLDSPILIVGAMVVGPEFGPLAAISVALVQKRPMLARRSLRALAVGFPVGTLSRSPPPRSCAPSRWMRSSTTRRRPIPSPTSSRTRTALSLFVAMVAGGAGVLSLTSAKSGALVGVLVSVTTIPAASNIGLAAAYGDWDGAGGAAAQLGINLSGIVAAGVVTLFVQRRYYVARRRKHLSDPAREAAGLPMGHSARAEHKTRGGDKADEPAGTRPMSGG